MPFLRWLFDQDVLVAGIWLQIGFIAAPALIYKAAAFFADYFSIDLHRKRFIVPLIAVCLVVVLLLGSANRVFANIDCQRQTGHPCDID